MYLQSLTFKSIMGGPLDGLPAFHLRLGKKRMDDEEVYFKILDSLPRFRTETLVIEEMEATKNRGEDIAMFIGSLKATGLSIVGSFSEDPIPRWIWSCNATYRLISNPRYRLFPVTVTLYIAPDGERIPSPFVFAPSKRYLVATKGTKAEAVLAFLAENPGWGLISPPSRSFEWRLIE